MSLYRFNCLVLEVVAVVCSFFGHKDTPSSVYPRLVDTIKDLIMNHGVDGFFVGNQGSFDSMVLKALRELKQMYPHIYYNVVLAYMPGEKQGFNFYEPTETFLPEGIESVPRRFAISWGNKWMVRESQIVVCYITHSWGGAVQFVEYAEKQGKKTINLAVKTESV